MTYFVGILDGAQDIWGVRIPDLPGCYSAGATPDEAISDAVIAARQWAEREAAKGHDIPTPRSVSDVIADPTVAFDAAVGEICVAVPLLRESYRAVKANISLDAGALAAIDAEAKRRGLTRSVFMVGAALDAISEAPGK
jgi:predicted RNase H-like HicB family nuclease